MALTPSGLPHGTGMCMSALSCRVFPFSVSLFSKTLNVADAPESSHFEGFGPGVVQAKDPFSTPFTGNHGCLHAVASVCHARFLQWRNQSSYAFCKWRSPVNAPSYTQTLERREQQRYTRAPCQERPSRPELRLSIGAQRCRASFTSHFWAPIE